MRTGGLGREQWVVASSLVNGKPAALDADPRPVEQALAVSVLIPLEEHRNYAEPSLRAWCSGQTFDRSRYEVIVVASPASPRRRLERIRALLSEHDRLLMTSSRHDVAQVVQAAATARGEFLFFSESHVRPNSDVLELCIARMSARPDWSALVCGMNRVTINRLGAAEATMYERDFVTGLTGLRWRNINDAGFFTRREDYFAVGGFDVSLGHYAEWVLAARFATKGFTVGYCPEIALWHLYSGDVQALRYFTENFVRGEITYHARGLATRRESLTQAPVEWTCRGSRRPELGRALVRLIADETAHAAIERRPPAVSWPLALRWLPVAVAGAGPARLAAFLQVAVCGARLFVLKRFAGAHVLEQAFKAYMAAIIHRGRLFWSDQFAAQRQPVDTGELWSAYSDRGDVGAGFYDVEHFEAVPFCWSEPVAVIKLDLPPGRYSVHVNTLSALVDRWERPEFYLSGRCVRDVELASDGNTMRFAVEVPARSDGNWLGWICRPRFAPEDSRPLGLPLVSILATIRHG